MENTFQRNSSWNDDADSSITSRAVSLNSMRIPSLITTKEGKKQTLVEYENSLVEDYKRRSQLHLAS